VSTQASTHRATGQATPQPHPSKVLLIVEENHSETSALSGMPYLRSLAGKFGRATAYDALTHPSLPNYLALSGGSTFGINDDNDPSSHHISGQSVFDQAIQHGATAKAYAESMPHRCDLNSSGDYAVRHNPWTYYSDPTSRANCRRHDVPLGSSSSGALHHDAASGHLPTVGMITPNLCNDAHDCSLTTADNWLHKWIPRLQSGPDWQSGRLAIVITFDENDGSSPNKVLTVVLSRRTRHVVSTAHFTHYSWTRYADQLIGAPLLRSAGTARSLRKPFHL
jgi:acid phosphatase